MKPCILTVVAHSGCTISRQQNCPQMGRVGKTSVLLVDDTVSLVKEYVSHYRKNKVCKSGFEIYQPLCWYTKQKCLNKMLQINI